MRITKLTGYTLNVHLMLFSSTDETSRKEIFVLAFFYYLITAAVFIYALSMDKGENLKYGWFHAIVMLGIALIYSFIWPITLPILYFTKKEENDK